MKKADRSCGVSKPGSTYRLSSVAMSSQRLTVPGFSEQRAHLFQHAPFGEVQVQRRYRNVVAINRAYIAIGWRRGFAAAKSDPVIGALTGIGALFDLGGLQIVFA